MKSRRRVVVAIGVLSIAAVVAASVFTKGTAPKRCRLLFGPTGGTILTVEVHRDSLSLSDGTGVQRFPFKGGSLSEGTSIEIPDATSSTRYTITSLSRYQDKAPAARDGLIVSVTVEDGETQFEQYCDVELRESSRPLAVAHFDGPLAVSLQTINWEIPETTRLLANGDSTDVRVTIGTVERARGCWAVVKTHEGESSCFPEKVFPYVRIEFPPQSPGAPPPTKTFPLDKFC